MSIANKSIVYIILYKNLILIKDTKPKLLMEESSSQKDKSMEITKLHNEIDTLYNELVELKKELEFMKEIFQHPTAMVYQMKRFTIKNKPVWINTQRFSRGQLLELDPCEEVQELLDSLDVKYKDRLD